MAETSTAPSMPRASFGMKHQMAEDGAGHPQRPSRMVVAPRRAGGLHQWRLTKTGAAVRATTADCPPVLRAGNEQVEYSSPMKRLGTPGETVGDADARAVASPSTVAFQPWVTNFERKKTQ